ncbi:hypothetical protein RCL1_006863 [Eukaryota sp. TZLM3-RCL]
MSPEKLSLAVNAVWDGNSTRNKCWAQNSFTGVHHCSRKAPQRQRHRSRASQPPSDSSLLAGLFPTILLAFNQNVIDDGIPSTGKVIINTSTFTT